MKRSILSVAVVLGVASLAAHAQEGAAASGVDQVDATTLDAVTVTAESSQVNQTASR